MKIIKVKEKLRGREVKPCPFCGEAEENFKTANEYLKSVDNEVSNIENGEVITEVSKEESIE